jgi:hypothetical protein
MMARMTVEDERKRRIDLWADLERSGFLARVRPEDLRQRRIYGGAQGIWVDKQDRRQKKVVSPLAYCTLEGTIRMISPTTA